MSNSNALSLLESKKIENSLNFKNADISLQNIIISQLESKMSKNRCYGRDTTQKRFISKRMEKIFEESDSKRSSLETQTLNLNKKEICSIRNPENDQSYFKHKRAETDITNLPNLGKPKQNYPIQKIIVNRKSITNSREKSPEFNNKILQLRVNKKNAFSYYPGSQTERVAKDKIDSV